MNKPLALSPLGGVRFGTPGKPILVLLHGFLGSHQDWHGLLPQLAPWVDGYCLDLPGHGLSRTVALQTTPAFDEVVALLLATLPAEQPFHLLGYSLGGRIALQVAAHCPTRLLSLTLESAHHGLNSPQARQQRLLDDGQWQQRLLTLGMDDFLAHWYQQPVFADLSESARQAMCQARMDNSPAVLAAMLMGTSLGHQQPQLPLPLPTVLLTGEQDRKFPQLAQAWRDPHLTHRVIDGAGHNSHASHPQAVVTALLSQIRSAPGAVGTSYR